MSGGSMNSSSQVSDDGGPAGLSGPGEASIASPAEEPLLYDWTMTDNSVHYSVYNCHSQPSDYSNYEYASVPPQQSHHPQKVPINEVTHPLEETAKIKNEFMLAEQGNGGGGALEFGAKKKPLQHIHFAMQCALLGVATI